MAPSRSSITSDTAPLSSAVTVALTPRAVGCGIFLGCAVCFANMYFGLQAGILNAMPMQSALLAFALFRSLRHHLSRLVTPMEITIIEIVAGSVGLAPFTSGFTGFIAALEFLSASADEPPMHLSLPQLLLWSAATCALGIVSAALFRSLFLLQERLRYPSATATGTLIGALFGEAEIISRADQGPAQSPRLQSTQVASPADPSQHASGSDAHTRTETLLAAADRGFAGEHNIGTAVRVLLFSLACSSIFVGGFQLWRKRDVMLTRRQGLVSYFVPLLRALPIFGHAAANDWMWALDLSPAYFGYGVIIGPSISASSLLGALVGWGILSPIAKHNKWAPGPVGSWDNGSRGWIVWVGMALILGESAIGLLWMLWRAIVPLVSQHPPESHCTSRPPGNTSEEHSPLLRPGSSASLGVGVVSPIVDDEWSKSSLATKTLVIRTAFALVLLYLFSLLTVFSKYVSVGGTFLAVVLIPFAGFISMRTLGETDNGAALAIARLAQFFISFTMPKSSSKFISANLLLAGAVEAGASQASQHMGGLRTALMTQTAPRAVFFAHMIGSFAGTFIATAAYRLYTTVKTIPSPEFGVPDGHMWLIAARLFHNESLPPKAIEFSSAAFALGACLSIARIVSTGRWWQLAVPSGVAMAVGMYITPAITLPRAIGSLVLVVGTRRLGIQTFILMCSATGLILGQGLSSLVWLAFEALRVSHL